jgi:hypothetical protein
MNRNERNRISGKQQLAERALARAASARRLAKEKLRRRGNDVTSGEPVDPKAPL